MDDIAGIFTSTTERTAWNITARHLARGQKDPVIMIIDGIEEERRRCIELLQAFAGRDVDIPAFMVDPNHQL
ncbi:hypothetical protein [Shinella kummerowiae]|uniref:Uncharacterized protein n=1 Tax=Shinella kummerowiae TaxID=417745 RepID=A0A6N8SIJ9_9HYPH|nr:hypothetical protein [Shinella kummerowiae]MCT7664077.1 hypothetical protein [Shinella kummerowiae]MXN48571.1 hypothetical protein [Shinella kummerowiae]